MAAGGRCCDACKGFRVRTKSPMNVTMVISVSQSAMCDDEGCLLLLFLAIDGFCTYLQLEYSEQAKAEARWATATFLLPAVQQRLSYGRPVLRILSVPNDTLITIREDGAIYFWSLQLKLKRKKPIFGKSTSRKSQWVTDIASMPQYNKLIVGTGSRELRLYEISNLEPYCQISGLEAVPLKLDYW
ncbi:WD repeat-containing protein on Y chromosome-like isoform X2 [Sigmodon hispidus]